MLMDKLIGHRGIRNHAPENTMQGFKESAKHFKWVEIDATLSSDEITILFHDEQIDDLTNGTGNLGDKTFNELQSLNANKVFPEYGECKIPLFSEFLKFAIDNDLYINVEIKDNDSRWELLTDKVIVEIENSVINTNKLLFSSFNHDVLVYLKNKRPDWIIGHLFEDDLDDWQNKCKLVNAKSIHLWNECAPAEIINEAKDMGLEIYVYTVNTKDEYNKFIELGVDGVFTDELPSNII